MENALRLPLLVLRLATEGLESGVSGVFTAGLKQGLRSLASPARPCREDLVRPDQTGRSGLDLSRALDRRLFCTVDGLCSALEDPKDVEPLDFASSRVELNLKLFKLELCDCSVRKLAPRPLCNFGCTVSPGSPQCLD